MHVISEKKLGVPQSSLDGFEVLNKNKDDKLNKNLKAIVNIIPNFAARYLGNKFGQNYNRFSIERVKKLSSNRFYWERNFNK